MKLKITLLTLTFLSFVACNGNKVEIARQPKDTSTQKQIDTSQVPMRHTVMTEDTTNQQQIDTAQYANLPYWTDSLRRFSDAYIDTFSIGSNKFRFVNPVPTHRVDYNSVTLEKLINGQWVIENLTLEDNIHGGNFSRDEDINGDGYVDIVNWIRFTGTVYFYNPKTGSFIDTSGNEATNGDWVLLDKARNIFCDFQQYKGMCGQINSTLYTFQGFKRIDLYNLYLDNCTATNNETNLITKLVLSKCIEGYNDSTVVVEETKLAKPIDTDGYDDHGKYPNGTDSYFDYKKYWVRRYKKLLGIK